MANSQSITASASPEVPMNENFDSIDWAFVYSRRHDATTGTTWGYNGGRWGGFVVAPGTVNLASGPDNYLAVARLSGAVVNDLNAWQNLDQYRRLYRITVSGGVPSIIEDHRSGPYGVFGYVPEINNFRRTDQSIAAATRTHLLGSDIAIQTAILMQVGTQFRWTFSLSKTAAGTAASTFDVSLGTTANSPNTALLTFTKPAGTANADHGIVTIDAIVRSIGGANGVMVGDFCMVHNGNTLGHAMVPCVTQNAVSPGAFDSTEALLHVGVNLTSGASDAITMHRMRADSMRLGGQV